MSKPVAWIVERAMSESRIEQCKPKKSACLSATPLYLHPDPRVAELEADVIEWANRFISLWNNVGLLGAEHKLPEGVACVMRKWAAEVDEMYREKA